jgi:ATP-binding cassette, subfamily B, bacterial
VDQIFKIIKLTSKFWKYYLATGTFVVLISLLNLANPIINKQIVDVIINNVQNGKGNFSLIAILLGLIIVSDVLITVFSNISGYLGDRLGHKLNTFLGGKFYEHVLDLEIGYFDNEPSGKVMGRLQRGIMNIVQFINQMLNNFLPFFLTAIFTVIYLAFYSWEIALLLALLFPLYIVISDKSSKAWREKQGAINTIQDSAYSRVLESINSIRVVKSFVTGYLELTTFKKKREEIEALSKEQSKDYHVFDVYRRLILNVILFFIYSYVIYFTYNGRYSISEMILLLQLVTQARFPLFAMSFILGQIQEAQAGSKDFFETLQREVQIKDAENAKELKNVDGDIKFEDVSFEYDSEKKVLEHISFTLKPGEKLALVGESGGGKSTIANLIMRFYEPGNGKILIENQDIQNVTQKSLHQNIAVVLQDSLLFSGTLAENIRYGRPDATDEEVFAAAKAANCDEFISRFQKKYDTEIGERGVKLSGGQKQRLSIARAILKNSPILILDEATSALDSKAEQEVQKALNELMKNRTTIIIAHRLSTIRSVDHIIVLKDGNVAEEGKPTELAQRNGIYAELLKLQSTVAESETQEEKLKAFDLV